MQVNYKKLWKLMIDRDIKKSTLREDTKISSSTMAKMSRNEYVSMEILVKICLYLGCTFDDIVEIEK